MTTVTDADREAAGDVVGAYRDNKNADWQGRIRRGECDDGYMVLAFARHREAEVAKIVAWLPQQPPHLSLQEYADAIEAGEYRNDA